LAEAFADWLIPDDPDERAIWEEKQIAKDAIEFEKYTKEFEAEQVSRDIERQIQKEKRDKEREEQA